LEEYNKKQEEIRLAEERKREDLLLRKEKQKDEMKSNDYSNSLTPVEYPELMNDLIKKLSLKEIESSETKKDKSIKKSGLKVFSNGTFKYFQYNKPDGGFGINRGLSGKIEFIKGTFRKRVSPARDNYGDLVYTDYNYDCYIMLISDGTNPNSPSKVGLHISWSSKNVDNPKIGTSTKICISGLNKEGNSNIGADYQDLYSPLFGCSPQN
jgi:hypothetical protein